MGQDMTVTYAYDPELAVVIPHLPSTDPCDFAAEHVPSLVELG